jgi:hypothetical protein
MTAEIFSKCAELFQGGNMSEIASQCPIASGFAGGIMGGLIAFGILIAIIFGLAIYVYAALAWQTIAKKLKHKKPWLAWIPIVNVALVLQLGGFHWAWIFLILVPILGWIALFVLAIIATWRICKKRKYPGWFSLAPIIPKIGGILYLILIGFLAWGKKK